MMAAHMRAAEQHCCLHFASCLVVVQAELEERIVMEHFEPCRRFVLVTEGLARNANPGAQSFRAKVSFARRCRRRNDP